MTAPPPERPGPQVTAEDMAHAVGMCDIAQHGDEGGPCIVNGGPSVRAALGTTLRPGGLVARAIADELERLRVELGQVDLNPGDPQSLLPGLLLAMDKSRRRAAEWREGKR